MDALEFIKTHCVMRKSDGAELYAHDGALLSWALDTRKALLNQIVIVQIAKKFFDQHKHLYPFQIAAVETSGIPLMTAIQLVGLSEGLFVNGVIVRKKRKKHMEQAHIDGVNEEITTIVVDDSINSGRSIFNAVKKLKDAGFKVTNAFSMTYFDTTACLERAEKENVHISYVYNLKDIGIDYQNIHKPKTNYDVSWTFASPDPNLRFCVAKSKPVIHKNTIMFGSDCGTFWCLDRHTGRIRWFFGTQDLTGKGIISSPIVDGEFVYFGAYDGILYCINADTGELIWSNKCCDWIGSSPLIVNDALYIGLEFNSKEKGGAMAAFDKLTGDLYWTHFTKVQLHGSPAYNHKHGYIVWGTNDGTVVVINSQNNEIVKEFDAKGAVKYAPATKDDLAVFGSFDGNIYVWDFVQDKVMFAYHTDDIVYSTPLIHDNKAFMGSADNQFVVIDLNNFTLVSAWDAGEKIHSSPSFIDGLVYFGTSKGELMGIYPSTCRSAIEYQFPERITNAIVADENHLFVYTVDNKLWAIKHG